MDADNGLKILAWQRVCMFRQKTNTLVVFVLKDLMRIRVCSTNFCKRGNKELQRKWKLKKVFRFAFIPNEP